MNSVKGSFCGAETRSEVAKGETWSSASEWRFWGKGTWSGSTTYAQAGWKRKPIVRHGCVITPDHPSFVILTLRIAVSVFPTKVGQQGLCVSEVPAGKTWYPQSCIEAYHSLFHLWILMLLGCFTRWPNYRSQIYGDRYDFQLQPVENASFSMQSQLCFDDWLCNQKRVSSAPTSRVSNNLDHRWVISNNRINLPLLCTHLAPAMSSSDQPRTEPNIQKKKRRRTKNACDVCKRKKSMYRPSPC
jgi:hypothetical protein